MFGKKKTVNPYDFLFEANKNALSSQFELKQEFYKKTFREMKACRAMHPLGSSFDWCGKAMTPINYRCDTYEFSMTCHYLNDAGELREHVFKSSEYPIMGWPLTDTSDSK